MKNSFKSIVTASMFAIIALFSSYSTALAAQTEATAAFEGQTFTEAYASVSWLVSDWSNSSLMWWIRANGDRINMEKSQTETKYVISAYGVEKVVVFKSTQNIRIAQEIAAITGRDKSAVLKMLNQMEYEVKKRRNEELQANRVTLHEDVIMEMSTISDVKTRAELRTELKQVSRFTAATAVVIAKRQYETAGYQLKLLRVMIDDLAEKVAAAK